MILCVRKQARETAVAVCSMLITFLQDVICVVSGFQNACSVTLNYFNAIHTPKTFKNSKVMRYNLKYSQ